MKIACYTTNSWISPLAVLRILGPATRSGLETLRGVDGEAVDFDAAAQADVVLIQRDFPRRWDAYSRIAAAARQAGKPLVYDLDDLLIDLPPTHPDAASGYYAESLLPMLHTLFSADCVTASSALLCETLGKLNPNVALLPNYLDDRFWALTPPRAGEGGFARLVIGFLGGDSHAPDLAEVAPALLRVAQRFDGRVQFRFAGAQPPPALRQLPNVDWRPADLDYARFAAAAPELGLDIAIAPLGSNEFNRCKSHIKYLEYAALGAAGIYADLEPYSTVVQPGVTGLLAGSLEAWEAHLTRLIEDDPFRRQLAAQAQADVRQNWLLAQHAHRWADLYAGLRPLPARRLPPELDIALAASREASAGFARRSAQQAGEMLELRSQLAAAALQSQALAAKLAQAELERNHFSARLWEVENSRPWQAYLRYRRWRGRLSAPFQRLAARLRGVGVEFPGGAPTHHWARPHQPDVIVFPVMDWETRTQRPQHLARQFARAGQRVFYLRTSFRDITALPGGAASSVQPIEENIFAVHLPGDAAINLYRQAMPEGLAALLGRAFAGLRKTLDIRSALCLVDLPFWTPLALRLRRAYGWKIVYDCMDYHPGFSSNTEAMWQMETTLARASDALLVTSRWLEQELTPLNRRCIRVPNGVDFEHFHQRPQGELPLAGLPRPIIGYYGAIADWFDAALVAALAQARPEWSFVLIGGTLYADLSPLQNLPNVHLLGEKPYRELPAYLHDFDVAIIPFKKTPLTEATNPVKLFEYLAAGKPVVATELDELRYYRDWAGLASTPETWLQALESARRAAGPEQIAQRVAFARQNTWEDRFHSMQDALTRLEIV